MSATPDPTEDRDRNRLRGFAIHLAIYFLTVAGCAVLNFTKTPDALWFIYPMVAWGAPLALHAAFVMGLFDGLMNNKGGPR